MPLFRIYSFAQKVWISTNGIRYSNQLVPTFRILKNTSENFSGHTASMKNDIRDYFHFLAAAYIGAESRTKK